VFLSLDEDVSLNGLTNFDSKGSNKNWQSLNPPVPEETFSHIQDMVLVKNSVFAYDKAGNFLSFVIDKGGFR